MIRSPITSKPTKRKCGICRTNPVANSMASVCSMDCAIKKVEKDREKKEADERRESRAADRKRKEEMMPLKKHLKLTEAVINRYVRLRDYHEGCCSCDKPSHWDGKWNASHFKSVGSNSLLRFHLWNIHKGCSECNLFKSGNLLGYKERLVMKIGPEKVQWLEDHKNGSKEYTAEYLIRMRRIFSKKCKRMEKRLGI